MPTPLRRRLRLARRGISYVVAVSLVLIAVLLGTASQLLPLADRNPDKVAAWLSARAGRPVTFDRVETAWTRRGPLLKLDNLRVGEAGQAFVIGDTEMLVSIYAGLLPGHAFSELRLRGLDLTLERADDGRWRVRGLPGQQQQRPGGGLFETLEALGELQVVDGKLSVIAPAFGAEAHASRVDVPRVDVRLQVTGDSVRAAVRAWPQVDGDPLDGVVVFDRTHGDGRVYAGARQADLAAWSSLLRLAGVEVQSGQGRAEAWAQLEGGRITQVTVDTALDDVVLRESTVGSTTEPDATAGLGRVEGVARWRLIEGGWRLDARRLRIGDEGQVQTLDGLTVAGGDRYAILAGRIDAAPLLAVAALSDRLDPALRNWLRATSPQGALRDLQVSGQRGGAMRASARIDGVAFAAVGDAPGISGLAGMLDGDQAGFSLRLDPQSPMRFDWPSGFGVVHTTKLDGTVVGWRDGKGWRIGTHALRIDGGSFGADARGSLWWEGDGSRPRIDLAVELDDAAVPVAKGFWVRHRMPPRAVEWLDSALQGGTVRHGRAIVSGDLDDWPFDDRNGSFEATARIEQGVIRFRPDWPAVEAIDADVSFVADGFDVSGTGRLAGVDISRIEAGIDHYRGGRLRVQAQGAGDSTQLLELLRDSPLKAEHGDTLDNLAAEGAARVGFDLLLPLKKGGQTQINGTVDVDAVQLSDARWDLAFDQVTGHAIYTRSGFAAESLSVRHEGQPGQLSLRAGDGHVRDSANALEAGLEATLAIGDLLDRAPEMGWLKPHASGRSPWTVGVVIPKPRNGSPAPTMLQLRSELVGTTLDLPEPLRKPAPEPLATTVETPLPLGSGDVRVALGSRMAVRARTGGGQTGVRIALGESKVDEAPPASGLVATGHASRLDAIDWIALGHAGTSGNAMPLRRIDVSTERLRLLGGVFPDIRLQVAPAGDGVTQVRTTGASLQGLLTIPRGDTDAITGRFERVHWRPDRPTAAAAAKDGDAVATATAADTTTGATTDATATGPVAAREADALDPSAIPALAFDIDDFRLNDAALGQATFRSRPTVAGMHIEQLRTSAGKQSVEITGDWNGQGASARTRLALGIDSQDMGGLLAGLGFGGRVGGGQGTVRLDASWPGSPAAFSPGTLDGQLTVKARDGQLLEVEPGAGRVLGLLSITQLPRRLMLDFGDLFSKGFAFNELGGTVQFADGMARSDDMLIDGPSAAIGIRGTTNLRTEHFNQTVEVRPKTGNLLAAVGAIAGGPMGAAIGAAANAVLQRPLGQLGAKTYHVTGPWKDPEVKVVSREQGRAATRTPPAPAG